MTSTDLSDLSLEASAPAAAHNRYHISQFIPISVRGGQKLEISVRGGQKLESSTNLGDRRERTYLELGRRICGGVLWAPSTTSGRGAPRT
jgi:hypothetical protein